MNRIFDKSNAKDVKTMEALYNRGFYDRYSEELHKWEEEERVLVDIYNFYEIYNLVQMRYGINYDEHKSEDDLYGLRMAKGGKSETEDVEYEVAKFAYDYCIEQKNYFKLNGIFSFSSNVDELSDYVQSRQ